MEQKTESFVLYYGYGHQEALSKYNIVIVEADAQTPESLTILRQSGAIVIAYISVMEVIPQSYAFSQLWLSDYLKAGEQIASNPDFGNYFADLRAKRWQQYLLRRTTELLQDQGYDGLLLDTIGNLESVQLIKDYQYTLHEAYRAYLKTIKTQFPQKMLIQNNGLDTVFYHAHEYIDGICWENPPIGRWKSRLWVEAVTRNLMAKIKDTPDFRVFILEERHRASKKVEKYALKHGWLYHKASNDYV